MQFSLIGENAPVCVSSIEHVLKACWGAEQTVLMFPSGEVDQHRTAVKLSNISPLVLRVLSRMLPHRVLLIASICPRWRLAVGTADVPDYGRF